MTLSNVFEAVVHEGYESIQVSASGLDLTARQINVQTSLVSDVLAALVSDEVPVHEGRVVADFLLDALEEQA